MKEGSLVRNEEYGTLGVIIEMGDTSAYVVWLTTPTLDPVWHICDLEVLCK